MNASPDFALTYPNLLSASLGARPLSCSDEFFAPASRMLADSEPVFIPDKYDDHGKWMDGWESRRCRQPDKTHDWCVVRLATVAAPKGVLIDTRHFTGNYPPHASLDGCHADEVDGATEWSPLLSKVSLQPDHKHYFPLTTDRAVSHLRLNIFPDGGVARLRLFGEAMGEPPVNADGVAEVSSLLCGGRIIAWNDSHFGEPWVTLKPYPAESMQDGWETRRRRTPGYDWLFLRLARPACIQRLEVDTRHFKGNFPAACSLQGHAEETMENPDGWPYLLPQSPLSAHQVHSFESQEATPVRTVRLCIFPDGGISRLRLFGHFVD